MHNVVALQIADSAFPAGGFAHSGGLEALAQCGEATGERLAELLRSVLGQQVHGLLTFVLAAHRDLDSLGAVNARCEAFLTSHVGRAASLRQGQAFVSSAERIFGSARFPAGPCHFAPAFGAVTACLGIEAAEAARLYLYVVLRDMVSSAVRLGVVGPFAGQAALHAIGPELERVAAEAAERDPAEAFQTAPLIDIVQTTHDRLYSRLFQS